MKKVTVYCDHSVLDRIEKGKISKEVFCGGKAKLCYSYQNLEEIVQGSDFLGKVDVLLTTHAKYLEFFESDVGSEQCNIVARDIEAHVEEVAASLESMPLGLFGLQDLQQKLIGGLRNKSNDELVADSITKFSDLVTTLEESAAEFFPEDFLNDLVEHSVLEFSDSTWELFDLTKGFSDDAHGYWSREFGIGPATLNNINGDAAFEKVAEFVERQAQEKNVPNLAAHMFSSLPLRRRDARTRKFTNQEVMLLMVPFNLIGYQRERKIVANTERSRADFRGDNWDMWHIANARHCNFFLTGDEKQALRAAAVYDHIGARCNVWYLQKDNENYKVVYAPDVIEVREFDV